MTITAPGTIADDLTPEQRRIVEAGDGPVVVIAGAGTGKTRVIVERVRWLLEAKGAPAAPAPFPDAPIGNAGVRVFPPAAEPAPRHGNPFDGPLSPEQILVLTYNVKAAAELGQRLDQAVGPATRSRMSVSNFHSFCQRILTENASDAGLPERPDVLDGVGQLLLLKEIFPGLDLRYHGTSAWSLGGLVGFINRAKDELVGPDDFDAFVATEREVYQRDYGSFDAAEERLEQTGHLEPVRLVRSDYAKVRASSRADAAGLQARAVRPDQHERTAEREARRNVIGTGGLVGRNRLDEEQLARIDELADTYVRDGAALEVLRLAEIGRVFRAYEETIAERGLLDFGEQIALVARLFKTRPNVLRRWQRQYRHILVDEFQDANVAQIELDRAPGPHAGPARQRHGRGGRRPVHLPLPGRQLRRLRGVRHALLTPARARPGRPRAGNAAPPRHRAELPQRPLRARRRQPPHRP